MALLGSIGSPADLKALPASVLIDLAQEIREFLITEVSRSGGHLGPNLGVVELTIALHRVFDSPIDSIIFDTGHQSYVHKLLTGRQEFSQLRARGGLSGYPSRRESEHDVVENSHASTSLSWAQGVAVARRLRHENRQTVAVIGDGALTGGMAWEALNNIAADKELPLVIVINDNERSYAPTIGGLADHLADLRTTRQYEQVLDWGKHRLTKTPLVGRAAYQAFHSMKKGAKDFWAPQGMFEDLGIKYLGPVDGHDFTALEHAFERAKAFGGPVLVHCITEKGRGYRHALGDAADRFHGIGRINPETGLPLEIAGRSWTDVFSDEILALGHERRDIVALTAAMMMPVGLQPFADAFPERIFDVGIAEQHAVTMSAGLAYGGLHPVVAIYATFLNRAFDQLLMDVAMHHEGVTFVLDRAGITGPDGASHHGMWDLSLAALIPGLRLAAPRDAQRLAESLRAAVQVSDAPTLLRFPKGQASQTIAAQEVVDGFEVLLASHDLGADDTWDVVIVAVGAMAQVAIETGRELASAGLKVRVIDPVWVLPIAPQVVAAVAGARAVVVIEDNLVQGGIGSALSRALDVAGLAVPVQGFGVPQDFHEHASRGELLEQFGLCSTNIAAAVLARSYPTVSRRKRESH